MNKTQAKNKFLKAFPKNEDIFDWVWENLINVKHENEFDQFVKEFNLFWGTRYTNKNVKSKTQFKNIVNAGYTVEDYKLVFKNIQSDEYHSENDYKYVTPEYVSRIHIFERFLNQVKANNNLFS